MRKNTLLEIITAITFLVFVGIYFYYSFYPFKVITLNAITIDKAEYCRGEWVKIELNFIKHMDVQAEVKWYIVDGTVLELESPGVSREVGNNDLHIYKQIPYSILPGNYNLRAKITHKINSLREPVVNTWNTPKFLVLDASECPNNPDRNLSFPDPVNKPDNMN